MPLAIVAVPIGNPEDITLRAITVLRNADVIIGEEPKPTRQLLKSIQIADKPLHFINEHTNPEDFHPLLELCRTKNVALVSDAGTPSFCDPGYQLTKLCRDHNITVTPVPGVSSLMALISVLSFKLQQFIYAGFPPRNPDERQKAILSICHLTLPAILMDTPYRLEQTLADIARVNPGKLCILGLDLTCTTEEIFEGRIADALAKYSGQKREFILLLYPGREQRFVKRSADQIGDYTGSKPDRKPSHSRRNQRRR